MTYCIDFLSNVQINYTSSILSMHVTIIEALTLEITSMNMLDLIVTSACMFFLFFSFLFHAFTLFNRNNYMKRLLTVDPWCECRYPNKNEQYNFFRHYLQPDNPVEVCNVRVAEFGCKSFKTNYSICITKCFSNWKLTVNLLSYLF